jgi:hypothetical protein
MMRVRPIVTTCIVIVGTGIALTSPAAPTPPRQTDAVATAAEVTAKPSGAEAARARGSTGV